MKTKIAKISATQFKDAVKWLWDGKEDGGCFHLPFHTDPESGREWCYVIGWHDHGKPYPGDDERYFVTEDSWYITFGIRYQERNNGMQTDMDIDFTIPSFKDGDCYDLSFDVPRKPKWGALATAARRMAREMMEVVRTAGDDLD